MRRKPPWRRSPASWGRRSSSRSPALLPLAFQNPHDRNDCVPIACRRRHANQFVDLAQIADRLHVTAVHSEDELVFPPDNSQQPLPTCRKCDGNGSRDAAGLRQDAHESHNIRARRPGSKRMLRLQTNNIAPVAEHDFRLERQLPEQCGTELGSTTGFANDKRACSTHIHDIVIAQFSCEDAWAKRPVPANVDTPEENNESHPYFPNRSRRYASSGPSSPSYASCATSSANGSVYRAIRNGPASTGSNPTSRISSAATFLLFESSPQ